ncbi:MAG: hypothetical protein WC541_03290 [Dehalococcoidia bacterium]
MYRLLRKVRRIVADQSGIALPMALIMLVLASIIVVPGLWALQSFLVINQDSETDTRGYYAADAGISDVIWRFDQRMSPPFPYTLPDKVNGMDVVLSQVKQPVTNGPVTTYSILSEARQGQKTIYNIYVEVDVNTSVSPFDFAIATTDGDINIYNPAQVTSTPAGHGDMFATGNINLTGGCESVDGIKAATGSISPSGCTDSYPNSAPVQFALIDTTWYLSEADKGGPAAPIGEIKKQTNYHLGPKHIVGDLYITTNSSIILDGVVWVDGNIFVKSSSVTCSGNGYLVASGVGHNITVEVGSELDRTINLLCLDGDVTVAQSAEIGSIYAPNGHIYMGNNGTVYGSLIGKSVTVTNNRLIIYQVSIGTPLPGMIASGTGAVLSKYSQ